MSTTTTETPLEDLPDDKLNERFAVECLGYERHKVWFNPPNTALYLSPSDLTFCTDANAVMPYLEKTGGLSPEPWCPTPIITFNRMARYPENIGWNVDLGEDNKVNRARTFARAACIALIKAKRASKV